MACWMLKRVEKEGEKDGREEKGKRKVLKKSLKPRWYFNERCPNCVAFSLLYYGESSSLSLSLCLPLFIFLSVSLALLIRRSVFNRSQCNFLTKFRRADIITHCFRFIVISKTYSFIRSSPSPI